MNTEQTWTRLVTPIYFGIFSLIFKLCFGTNLTLSSHLAAAAYRSVYVLVTPRDEKQYEITIVYFATHTKNILYTSITDFFSN